MVRSAEMRSLAVGRISGTVGGSSYSMCPGPWKLEGSDSCGATWFGAGAWGCAGSSKVWGCVADKLE